MSPSHDIAALLRQMGTLAETLDDLHVRHVTVASSGAWSFEKLGRQRTGDEPIGAERLAELHEAVGEEAFTEAWSIRTYRGHHGPTFLLERRPTAIVDRIPDEVLQSLKKRARRDGVTVIAGPPGSGKSNVLLWATRHLADEPIVLVTENPPAELPGDNVLHVRTPVTALEHRNVQRLMRRAPNVSWDRVSGLEDVNTLLGGANARRRCFTLDSTDTISTLRRFEAWRALGYEANLDVLLQMTSSVIGRAEVLDLLVWEDGAWKELYTSGGSRLGEIEKLGRRSRDHATTRPGIEPDIATRSGEQPRTPEETRSSKVDALRAGIRKRPGQPTQDFESPNTIPVPELSESSFDERSESDETSVGDKSETSQLSGDDSTGLLEEFEGFEEDDSTSSGEIDLQGFLARKETLQQEDSGGMLPEETKQYDVGLSNQAAPERPASEPDEIIPGVDLNAEATGTYNLENLKITRVEDVEESDMDELRAMREESLAESSNDDSGEFASVEISDDDLIYDDEEEWEEVSGRTAVASADAYDSVAKEITGRIEDPPDDASDLLDGGSDIEPEIEPDVDTSPSISSPDIPAVSIDDEQEDTAEFSIGDKIRIIRKRLKGEEA